MSWDTLRQDLRFSLRSLRSEAGLTPALSHFRPWADRSA